MNALIRESEIEYKLRENAEVSWVWITVGKLSVRIASDDDGVRVAIYKLNKEMAGQIAACSAPHPG